MTESLEALGSGPIRQALRRLTRSPASGALAGATAAAAIHSSSAVIVTAVGLVAAGHLTFSQGLGVVLGANVGTTATGWMVALLGFRLDVGRYAPALLFAGILGHVLLRRRLGPWGLAAAGLALLFLGLSELSAGLAGAGEFVDPRIFPGDRWWGLLGLATLGAGVTALTQSSTAGVAAALAMVHAGTLELTQAAALVVGMDVGTTGGAALATLGAATAARRTGYAHVVFNLVSAGAALLLVPLFGDLAAAWSEPSRPPPEILLVGFHTFFNLAGVCVAIAFADRLARVMERVVPEGAVRIDCEILRRVGEGLESGDPWPGVLAQLDGAEVALVDVQRCVDDIRSKALLLHEAERQAAVMHHVDHGRRVLGRSYRFQGGSSDAPALAGVRRAVVDVLRRVSGSPDREAEVHARRVYRHLAAEESGFRHELLAGPSGPGMEVADVLRHLDESRFLRRLVHHAWRIAAHASDEPSDTDAEELAQEPD
jgi:phosphate:Na+ symporter